MTTKLSLLTLAGLLISLLAACSGTTVVYVTPPPSVTAATTEPVVETLPPDPADELSGTITFGTKYDPDTLAIPKPLTRFKRTFAEIAWSASFSRVPGATTVTWVMVRQSSSGAEETLWSEDQTIGSPDYTVLANSGDLAFLVDNKVGTYVMRYIESGDIIAEGSFKLVK